MYAYQGLELEKEVAELQRLIPIAEQLMDTVIEQLKKLDVVGRPALTAVHIWMIGLIAQLLACIAAPLSCGY